MALVAEQKKLKKTVVTINGSFDVLHFGHIDTLLQARRQGDYLVVLVNSDKSIQSYKGSNRPIISEKQRGRFLALLDFVDCVTIFNEINPKKVLSKIKPDIHCIGLGWGKNCIERETVERGGGRIYVISSPKLYSTSGLMRKIADIESRPINRAVYLDFDELIGKEFNPSVWLSLGRLSKLNYKLILLKADRALKDRSKDDNRLKNFFKKAVSKKIIINEIYHYSASNRADSTIKNIINQLIRSVNNFGIDLNNSWLIGSSENGVFAGREVNIINIKLGQPMENIIQPKHYADNFNKALQLIMDRG